MCCVLRLGVASYISEMEVFFSSPLAIILSFFIILLLATYSRRFLFTWLPPHPTRSPVCSTKLETIMTSSCITQKYSRSPITCLKHIRPKLRKRSLKAVITQYLAIGLEGIFGILQCLTCIRIIRYGTKMMNCNDLGFKIYCQGKIIYWRSTWCAKECHTYTMRWVEIKI